MNAETIFWIIIAIIAFDLVFERLLEWLNDRNWSDHIPEELQGYFDQDKLKRSLSYHKEKERLGMISTTLSTLVILAMLFFGGFAWVDEQVRTVSDHPILLPVLFFGILGFASSILGLPFSIYNTFVIEEKYGFNKTTKGTFVLDLVKGWVIGGIIGGGILALIVWFYRSMGEHFWFYAWGLVVVFTLFTGMFYARLILPLFNKLEPMKQGELRDEIENFCEKVGFKLKDLYVMDGSKRSSKANAFFSGLGPKKMIVLFDTLIEKHTVRELVAVLAHEIGHYKKKHTLGSMFLSILQTGIMLYLLGLLVNEPALSQAMGASNPSFHLGLLAFSLLYSPLSMMIGIGMNVISRKNEYEADRFARDHYDGEALGSALKKMSSEHLSNIHPHPAYVFVHYSHPPLLNRVRALNNVPAKDASV